MKKRLLAIVLPALLLGGCMSGPSYLFRSVDDFENKNYEKDPLLTGVLCVIPVYPIMWGCGLFVDCILLNPIQFWGYDIWDKEGAAFTHEQPTKEHTPWFKQ